MVYDFFKIKSQGLGGLNIFLLKSYSWLWAVIGHKCRCPDHAGQDPMLLLIRFGSICWYQLYVFLKRRETSMIFHF